MKTVFPTAFVFRQEKGIPGVYLDAKDKQLYQLTIECGGLGDRKSLDSAALVERTQTFKNGLLKIVIHHHKVIDQWWSCTVWCFQLLQIFFLF